MGHVRSVASACFTMHVSLLSTHSYATCALENGSTAFCRFLVQGTPFAISVFQLIWCYVFSSLSHRPGIAGRDWRLTNREGGAKEVWSDTLLKAITCGNLVQVLLVLPASQLH